MKSESLSQNGESIQRSTLENGWGKKQVEEISYLEVSHTKVLFITRVIEGCTEGIVLWEYSISTKKLK